MIEMGELGTIWVSWLILFVISRLAGELAWKLHKKSVYNLKGIFIREHNSFLPYFFLMVVGAGLTLVTVVAYIGTFL